MNRSADDIARMYDQRAKDVLRYIARRAPDPEVAVDLLGETFAQAIAQRDAFRGQSDEELIAWIFSIARSQLSDYWRRGRYERAAMDRLGVERRALSDAEYDRVEQLMELDDVRELLAEELERLPYPQREVLQLRIVDELSYPEVAAAIGTTEQTARARVSRGLAALRRVAVVQELRKETRHA